MFVANDRYYRGRPLIDTVTYKIVPSSEIAYQMLKNGEVDYSGFTPGAGSIYCNPLCAAKAQTRRKTAARRARWVGTDWETPSESAQ